MAKAKPHRSGFQGTGAFVGIGGAVETCPEGEAHFRQFFRRLLTVHTRQEGYCPRLILPRKDLHPQFFQPPDGPEKFPVFPAENRLLPHPEDIPKPLCQSRIPRYIQGPRLQPVRQIFRHILLNGCTSGTTVQQRAGILPA